MPGAINRRLPAHVSRDDLASAGYLALIARSADKGDTYASLHIALDQLPPSHARVLRSHYLEEATLDDISVELGDTKERVRQIRESAWKKLREEFVVPGLWQSILSRP